MSSTVGCKPRAAWVGPGAIPGLIFFDRSAYFPGAGLNITRL
jgi:hypothetical protein